MPNWGDVRGLSIIHERIFKPQSMKMQENSNKFQNICAQLKIFPQKYIRSNSSHEQFKGVIGELSGILAYSAKQNRKLLSLEPRS